MMDSGKYIPLSFSANVNDGSVTFLVDSKAPVFASSGHCDTNTCFFIMID